MCSLLGFFTSLKRSPSTLPLTAKTQNKTKQKAILFSLGHTYIQFWVIFNNSRSVEASGALPKGAVILHLREFRDVRRVGVVGPVFSLTEFKALLLVVLLAFCLLGGLVSIYRGVHDAVFDFHVSTQVALQVELAGAVRALEGLAASVEMHVAEEVVHSVKRLPAHLAFERLHRQVDNHMRFQGLLLDKGLEADMALEGPHAGVDQHVSLQVGRQGEFSGTDITLEFFHALVSESVLSEVVDLDELHAALGANVRPHVLVLHQVVLQLAAVGEGLVALCALVRRGSLMAGQVTLQVRIGWKLEATLGADMALAVLVFVLVGPQFTGVGKATATEATAVGFHV